MKPIYNEADDIIIRRILNLVADDENPEHIPQPLFIIGRHGTGKSTLLRSLVAQISDKWPEPIRVIDGKSIFSSNDIIRKIEGDDYDISINNRTNIKETKRRIVIIDDIDYYFQRATFDDQYILRNYLNHQSSPLIIATLSEVNASIADYRAPFFEGVRLIYIPPLDISSTDFNSIPPETKERIATLLKFLPKTIASLKIAYSIVSTTENREDDLIELTMRMTPLYRSILVNMPIYSQQILYSLAKTPLPSTLSDLRESTGLPSGTISTYLRQLIASDIIRKIHPEQKGTPYEIKDKLFQHWLSSEI